VFGGSRALKKFEEQLNIRKKRFNYTPSSEANNIAKIIEKNGFYIIKDFISKEKVEELRILVENKLNTGSCLIGLNNVQKNFKNSVPFAAIEQPFVNVHEIISIAL
jgi:hypothetical protein